MKVWKVILAACVIFLAGSVTGALVFRLTYERDTQPSRPQPDRPPPSPRWGDPNDRFLKKLQSELQLTPEQYTRVETILKDSRQRMKEIWDPVAAKAHEEFKRVRTEIIAELTPEQQKQFELIKPPDRSDKKRWTNGPSHHKRSSDTNEPKGNPQEQAPSDPDATEKKLLFNPLFSDPSANCYARRGCRSNDLNAGS